MFCRSLFNLMFLALFLPDLHPVCAQVPAADYITIQGEVKDKWSQQKLGYANISIPGSNIGTITNPEGEFTLKISDTLPAAVLEVSHLGYYNSRVPLNDKKIAAGVIWLTPASATLDEVVVHGYDPVWVIEEAVKKIPDNYSLENNRQTGFYREIAQKKRHYITVAEAIVDIYKTPYTDGTERDQIRIFKGRRLLSQKQGDTLAVKLQGGPNLFILADVVKNPEILLSKENLTCYDFRMEEAEVIGSRPQFVVSFRPRVNPPYALYYGKMYIDRERLAFSRIELNLSMDDKKEATEAILRKKPAGLRFKPLEAASIITYKYDGKVNYLNYVRNSLRFKCDWKRRLFSTNYTVLSETVMTDKVDNRISVPIGAIFHSDEIFSEKVSDFSDENFWGKYNIIEPTESLEDAVSKLKKLQ